MIKDKKTPSPVMQEALEQFDQLMVEQLLSPNRKPGVPTITNQYGFFVEVSKDSLTKRLK